MEKRKAIYPGSFDPVTNGHLDLIKRALALFDHIYVVLAINPAKETFFNVAERLEFLQRALKPFEGVTIDSFDGLTVEYAKRKNVHTIIRGLRATSDFDYEFQMALTNRKLSQRVDTIFLMPQESFFYLSSRLIKEVAMLKGDISGLVPSFVAEKLRERFG